MRIRIRTLVAVLAAAAISTSFATSDAHARAKKKGKAKKVKKPPRPRTLTPAQRKAVKSSMGRFRFGMSKEQVIALVRKQVNEEFAEKIANTHDVALQDQLRSKAKIRVARLEKSFVKFTGKRVGWDVSIIDDQYRHKTDESMMVYWENHEGKDQRRFFFFWRGKLWKMFIQVNASGLPAKVRNFAAFQTVLENKFGKGDLRFKTDNRGEERPYSVTWTMPGLRLDAINKLSFYNAFCMVLTSPKREADVLALRKRKAPPKKGPNNVIKSIVDDGSDQPDLDDGAGAVDDIIKGKAK